MKQFFFVVILLFTRIGFSMVVEDPKNQANEIKLFFPSQRDLGFVCNQPTKFLQNTSHCDMICNVELCRADCQSVPLNSFLVEAENCSNPLVDVVSTLSWSLQVANPGDQKFGQTWIPELLSSMDYFIVPTGSMVIDIAGFGQGTLVDENGDENPIMTVIVLLYYQQAPNLASLQYELDLQAGKTGVEQVLYFGEPDGSTFFLKRWGFTTNRGSMVKGSVK